MCHAISTKSDLVCIAQDQVRASDSWHSIAWIRVATSVKTLGLNQNSRPSVCHIWCWSAEDQGRGGREVGVKRKKTHADMHDSGRPEIVGDLQISGLMCSPHSADWGHMHMEKRRHRRNGVTSNSSSGLRTRTGIRCNCTLAYAIDVWPPNRQRPDYSVSLFLFTLLYFRKWWGSTLVLGKARYKRVLQLEIHGSTNIDKIIGNT
jgi:hypothetical protein